MNAYEALFRAESPVPMDSLQMDSDEKRFNQTGEKDWSGKFFSSENAQGYSGPNREQIKMDFSSETNSYLLTLPSMSSTNETSDQLQVNSRELQQTLNLLIQQNQHLQQMPNFSDLPTAQKLTTQNPYQNVAQNFFGLIPFTNQNSSNNQNNLLGVLHNSKQQLLQHLHSSQQQIKQFSTGQNLPNFNKIAWQEEQCMRKSMEVGSEGNFNKSPIQVCQTLCLAPHEAHRLFDPTYQQFLLAVQQLERLFAFT